MKQGIHEWWQKLTAVASAAFLTQGTEGQSTQTEELGCGCVVGCDTV